MQEYFDQAEIKKLRHYQYLVERRRRLRVILIVAPAALGGMLLLTISFLSRYIALYLMGSMELREELMLFVVPIALAMIAASAVALLMTYLQTGFKSNAADEVLELSQQAESRSLGNDIKISIDSAVANSALAAQVESLKSEVARISEDFISIDENRKLQLVELVTSRIQQDAADSLWQTLQKQVAEAAMAAEQYRDISKQFDAARSRLAQEVSALGRRGNLNLSLGVVTTIVGLIFLGYFVFTAGDPSKDPFDLAVHFVPRLTLVLFIEVFAYFFLRLYKSSLSEIKYFQNEVTNMEAKYIALKTALNIGVSVIRTSLAPSSSGSQIPRETIFSKKDKPRRR